MCQLRSSMPVHLISKPVFAIWFTSRVGDLFGGRPPAGNRGALDFSGVKILSVARGAEDIAVEREHVLACISHSLLVGHPGVPIGLREILRGRSD